MMWWPKPIYFGESVVALALAIFIALCLIAAGRWARAGVWLASVGLGASLVLLAKLAFEFEGWSMPAVGLYSVSGHAMLTAAVYPMLLMLLGSARGPDFARYGLYAGLVASALMGVVLVTGYYHTLSETIAGTSVGLVVTWVNVRGLDGFKARHLALSCLLCLALLAVVWSALRPARHEVRNLTRHWLGASEQYYRSIDPDPQTGRAMVTVGRRRLSGGSRVRPGAVGQSERAGAIWRLAAEGEKR